MEVCCYGCGHVAIYQFKKGKMCCSARANLCPAQIEKRRLKCQTIDPKTGLTPLQMRQLKLKTTIDPETGLTLMQLKTEKARQSNLKVNPETGLTKLQESHKKLAVPDPLSGESAKSLQAKRVIDRLKQEVDPETGLTRWEASRIKSKNSNTNRTPAQIAETLTKRAQTMNTLDPISGMSKRQKVGLKVSKTLNQIDTKSGLSRAQLRAQKNLANEVWLNGIAKGKASKESLRLFDPLIDYCNQQGIEWKCGTRGKSEWWIKDSNGQVRFYDFVLLDLKLIVEYHGETWHPNPTTLTEHEWHTWRAPGSRLTAQEQHQKDMDKMQLALAKGFEFTVVWSSDNLAQSIRDLIEIIAFKNNQFKGCL